MRFISGMQGGSQNENQCVIGQTNKINKNFFTWSSQLMQKEHLAKSNNFLCLKKTTKNTQTRKSKELPHPDKTSG